MPQRSNKLGCLASIIGLLLLAGSIAGTHYYFNIRPDKPSDTAPSEKTWPVNCTGHVDAEHGVSQLTAPMPGRVVEVPAQEGTTVAAGAPLLKLDDQSAQLTLQGAKAALAAAQEQKRQAEKLAEQHGGQVKLQEIAIDAAQQRVVTARKVLDRKREQVPSGNVPAVEIDLAESQLRELELAHKAEVERLRELKQVDPEAKLRLAELEVQANQLKVEQAKYALKQHTLVAPAAGEILRVSVSVGDTAGVSPTTGILFRPAGDLVVRAEIEQEFASRVKPGQAVKVVDEADPNSPEWTGKVERLSNWIGRKRSIVFEPDQLNDVRTLEGLIRLEPGQPPLRLGQRVRVTIKPG